MESSGRCQVQRHRMVERNEEMATDPRTRNGRFLEAQKPGLLNSTPTRTKTQLATHASIVYSFELDVCVAIFTRASFLPCIFDLYDRSSRCPSSKHVWKCSRCLTFVSSCMCGHGTWSMFFFLTNPTKKDVDSLFFRCFRNDDALVFFVPFRFQSKQPFETEWTHGEVSRCHSKSKFEEEKDVPWKEPELIVS